MPPIQVNAILGALFRFARESFPVSDILLVATLMITPARQNGRKASEA